MQSPFTPASLWEHLYPREKERILQWLIRTIIVSNKGIEVRLRDCDLYQLNRELTPTDKPKRANEGNEDTEQAKAKSNATTLQQTRLDNGDITLFMPLIIKKKTGRQSIILPADPKDLTHEEAHEGKTPDQQPHRDITLVTRLVQAHLWKRELSQGKYAHLRPAQQSQRPRSRERLANLPAEFSRAATQGRHSQGNPATPSHVRRSLKTIAGFMGRAGGEISCEAYQRGW